MMKPIVRRALKFTLAAWSFGLISGWAHASVFLMGTPEGRPGDVVDFSLVVTPGTTLDSIDVIPDYDGFRSVLTLLDFQETLALTQGNNGFGCMDGLCAIFYVRGKSFPQETVLATWHFRVADDAAIFVDANGEIPFDLGVGVGADLAPLPEGQVFRVLSVPEPSSYLLMAAGLSLLIGNWYRRGLSGS